jgi:hypothetical protein
VDWPSNTGFWPPVLSVTGLYWRGKSSYFCNNQARKETQVVTIKLVKRPKFTKGNNVDFALRHFFAQKSDRKRRIFGFSGVERCARWSSQCFTRKTVRFCIDCMKKCAKFELLLTFCASFFQYKYSTEYFDQFCTGPVVLAPLKTAKNCTEYSNTGQYRYWMGNPRFPSKQQPKAVISSKNTST